MRYQNIQLLRVAAAVGVVLFHLGSHAPAFTGVDPDFLRNAWLAGIPVPLFFAVSGFVLTHAVRSTPPLQFLFARLLRLYPGYWLALLGMLGLMGIGVYTELHQTLVRLVRLSTFTLWPAGAGHVIYFLGIEWSLVYEVFLSVALLALSRFGVRRGLPILTGVWLAAILVKIAFWPMYASDVFPHWSKIALSAYNVPFLFGVLAYYGRDHARRWRWVVLAASIGLLAFSPVVATGMEQLWLLWGLATAGVVWLAVQFGQMSQRNPLARVGDWTYGLYLVHVPLMLAVFHVASRAGWSSRVEVVWAALVVALFGGLAFGFIESTIHSWLRPLAKRATGDRLVPQS